MRIAKLHNKTKLKNFFDFFLIFFINKRIFKTFSKKKITFFIKNSDNLIFFRKFADSNR